MSKYDVEPRGEHWARLRTTLASMSSLLEQPSVNVVDLAKLYEASAEAMLRAVEGHGLSSMRFEAAHKALDLSTARSALERFLGRGEPGATH